MKLNYTDFLKYHQQLQAPELSWHGHLYLPPCNCYVNTPCKESTNKYQFDFSMYKYIEISQLTDICKYTSSSTKSRDERSVELCKKYSLNNLHDSIKDIDDHKLLCKAIVESDTFKASITLLKSDLKLLFPLSGSSYVFKRRQAVSSIKYQITCSKSSCYIDQKSVLKTPSNKIRKCSTTKPITKDKICSFSINVFLDIKTLNWYIKWKGIPEHSHHEPTKLHEYKIGQYQLTSSMMNEINKLHKSNVSSAIQQTVLLNNNDVTIPLSTIFNKQYKKRDNVLLTHTDAESLLAHLKDEPNVTYFAMYAESASTPLLTLHKTKRSRIESQNNIQMTGYVKVYPDSNATSIQPQIDSSLKQTLKNLLVKNADNGKIVKVLLTAGWARDEDLRVLRKFPEVLKMDCTFKTNREGRPLFNIVCKDSNNKLTTVFRCLLPSEKRAIFQSILISVLPKVLGQDTCSRIRFIITDGDSQ